MRTEKIDEINEPQQETKNNRNVINVLVFQFFDVYDRFSWLLKKEKLYGKSCPNSTRFPRRAARNALPETAPEIDDSVISGKRKKL